MNHPHHSTAILVDGGFFLKRYRQLISKDHSARQVADNLYQMALSHVKDERQLYRIFYYDCLPFEKKVQHLITHQLVDFGRTDQHHFRKELFEALKQKRKMALRLGYLKDSGEWTIKSDVLKKLLNGKLNLSEVKETDISYNLRQKGIDMKIGIDIATLTLKKFVDQIVLISGDADFVPASKLARTEGIDFILDPMWNNIDPALVEHIDGLRSACPRPSRSKLTEEITTVDIGLGQRTDMELRN